MTEDQITKSQDIVAALKSDRRSTPPGFAFRVMQTILAEKIRRAEVSAYRQALILTAGFTVLALVAIAALVTFGLSDIAWFSTIPVIQLLALLAGMLGFACLDRFLAGRLEAERSEAASH